jgi:hypothetical protein
VDKSKLCTGLYRVDKLWIAGVICLRGMDMYAHDMHRLEMGEARGAAAGNRPTNAP